MVSAWHFRVSQLMPSALPQYTELHCLSNFTFLRGASHPEELVQRAHELGYSALAITDECSLAGVVRAHVAAKACGLKLIIGTEIALADGPQLILLATDRESYGNLSALIALGRRRTKKGGYQLTCADLGAGVPDCLALLLPDQQPDSDSMRFIAERFPQRTWIAVELLAGTNDSARLAMLRKLGASLGLPLAASSNVHMHRRSRRPLQDTLTAIRLGIPVHQLGHALHPNAERHLRSLVRLARVYPPELLSATVAIAQRCTFSLDSLRYEYPEEVVPLGETATSQLRRLTEDGLKRRFPQGVPEKVRRLIEHELELIAELGYEHFFLTVEDIVRFARSRKILCQGRGSAANSAVCHALGITEVNPEQQEVLFERFVSRERREPPDIDVDFEHQRREEVIQHIYEKYGRDRAALAATVICYKPRSALRDVGKALGFDLPQVDRLARSLAWWDGRQVLPERLAEAGFDPHSRVVRQLMVLVNTLVRFPRHLSQHVGGFVISRGPLARLVPIENAAMAERSVIQWDKDDIDALGLLKVDVLSLGMLSAIRRALDLINHHRGTALAMDNVPREDPRVYEMISRADTVGVFQIESRAQMSMLPRLRPREFYDLVIEVAIVRPGPIQGGMVHPYLRRRMKLEEVDYPSVEVESVLRRTLGVPIFQEQVMQLAVAAAGFTPGEADQLRRSMAAWHRNGDLEPFRDRLIQGMLKKGYSQDFAERIYRQIQGFGEYGFPESHSISFALLAYVSAWLKRYEPAAFTCALINSQPMGFYAPAQLVQDARRHGVEVRPVAVAASDWDCALETATDHSAQQAAQPQPALRLGLRMIKGLSQTSAERLVAARTQASFTSIDDVVRRAQLSRSEMETLAQAGALADLAPHRRAAHWLAAGTERLPPLLAHASAQENLPELCPPSEGQELIADYASTGLTLGRHPLMLLRPRLTRLRMSTASEMHRMRNGQLARAAGIVIGRQRPGTAKGIVFVTLEDETGPVNVIVRRDLVERQRRELLASRLLGVHGVLQREGKIVHLIARRLVDHSQLLGALATRSRDFR
jgi:error-prone DNA polymerase